MDPVLTNLVYPLSLVALGAWIKRQFERRDEKDDRIADLLEERENKKEEAIMEWRQRFQSTLCDVKVKVDEISDGLHERVPFKVCDEREKKFERALEDHDRRIRKVGG
jgi:hypothetical protein